MNPKIRGTGVGTKLMNVAKVHAVRTQPQPEDQVAEAIQPGYRGVSLLLSAVLPTADGFYLRQGFTYVGEINLQRAQDTFHGMLYQQTN